MIGNLSFFGMFLTVVVGFASCVDTYNSEIGTRESRIRDINRSVQAQKYICDGIEEPVYYRGRKIYNGCHTRYYKYQSTTTGKMYKPKRKPVCQELGERPFTEENLAEIKRLRDEIKVEHNEWGNQNLMVLALLIFLFIVFCNSDLIDEKLGL